MSSGLTHFGRRSVVRVCVIRVSMIPVPDARARPVRAPRVSWCVSRECPGSPRCLFTVCVPCVSRLPLSFYRCAPCVSRLPRVFYRYWYRYTGTVRSPRASMHTCARGVSACACSFVAARVCGARADARNPCRHRLHAASTASAAKLTSYREEPAVHTER
jgi:hypothetical protein